MIRQFLSATLVAASLTAFAVAGITIFASTTVFAGNQTAEPPPCKYYIDPADPDGPRPCIGGVDACPVFETCGEYYPDDETEKCGCSGDDGPAPPLPPIPPLP